VGLGVAEQHNSIQSILHSPISQISEFASEGFKICTHTTSLSQDLLHIGSGKKPRNRKKPFTGKKGKKPSGEQQRRISLQDGQKR